MAFQAFLASIEAPELRTVAEHWNAARSGARMPGWEDIDPIQIGRSLRYVWAWKYDRATDGFIGRLAGDEIVRAFGKSPRGIAMSEYFTPEIYRVFYPWQRRVVLEPALLHCTGMVYSRLDRSFRGERIVMPLASDGAVGDGILGATIYGAAVDTAGPGQPNATFGEETVDFYPLDPA